MLNTSIQMLNTNTILCASPPPPQVLPKMTSHVVNEIDNILRNKPYSKKDYRS